MHIGDGLVNEIVLLQGETAVRILCAPNLIPSPGQFLLAHADASDSPLAVPIFPVESTLQGFLASPPLPVLWIPGTRLNLIGPLGHGFSLPSNVRRVALVAWSGQSTRLLSLIQIAFKQNAEVVLVTDDPMLDLPLRIEVQPFSALTEIADWADFMAIDVTREALPEVQERFGLAAQVEFHFAAQVLVSAPMPCGGVAECGICAVRVKNGWKMICEDGPVFQLNELS